MNPISVLKWLHVWNLKLILVKFRSWSPTAAINVQHTETICHQSPAVMSHWRPLLQVQQQQQQQNKTCLRKLLTEFIQFLLKRRLFCLCIHHLIPDLSCKQQPLFINLMNVLIIQFITDHKGQINLSFLSILFYTLKIGHVSCV